MKVRYHAGAPWVLGEFQIRAGDERICRLPHAVSQQHNGDAALLLHAARMYEAICELLDAPRDEHLAARLNDQENAAVDRMRLIRSMIEETATLPR